HTTPILAGLKCELPEMARLKLPCEILAPDPSPAHDVLRGDQDSPVAPCTAACTTGETIELVGRCHVDSEYPSAFVSSTPWSDRSSSSRVSIPIEFMSENCSPQAFTAGLMSVTKSCITSAASRFFRPTVTAYFAPSVSGRPNESSP